MARSRNIKPQFFLNEDLVELRYEVRLLFIGLWTLADREGRLEDRPKKIKMNIFPADDVDVESALSELHANGFVLRYEVENIKLIQILNFSKHQKPHHQEKPSELPPPNLSEPVRTKVSVNPSDSLNTDSLNTDSLNTDCLINCPEPLQDSEPSNEQAKINLDENDPVVIELPTNRFNTIGEVYQLRKSKLDEFQQAYPAVDFSQTLARIKSWLQTNPDKRKTHKGMPRFLDTWLAKEQNNPNRPTQPNRPQGQLVEGKFSRVTQENIANLESWLNEN